MSVEPEKAKGELLDRVADLVRDRLGSQAATTERFVRQCFDGVDPEDLVGRNPEDIYGQALTQWHLAQTRRPREPKVAVYSPDVDAHGWQCPHTVVDVVTDDMPFLVDSITMELTRHNLGIHLVVHPILAIGRGADGRLVDLGRPSSGNADVRPEAFLHVEVDRVSDPAVVHEVTADLRRVLGDVRAAVKDWEAIKAKVDVIVDELHSGPPPLAADELDEAKVLLRWMANDHFTFLGYREYALAHDDGTDVLAAVPGSGLGILSDEPDRPPGVTALSADASRVARDNSLLVLTKANARATVHRPAHLDYVGVKSFDDDGGVVGERRFLGLYTEAAYGASALEVPVVRRKVEAVVARAGFPRGSHQAKSLLTVLEAYPRDELFQATVDELFAAALGIARIEERKQVRLFARRDVYGRFYSCLLYLPRDRYTTAVRLRMEAILVEALGGTGAEHTVHMSESVLVRLHFLVHFAPGDVRGSDRAGGLDVPDIERRLADGSRSWEENLRDALVDGFGEEEGVSLHRRYRNAFPAAYREDFPARAAVPDIRRIESLAGDGSIAMCLWHRPESGDQSLRFKLVRAGPSISLSEVLPVLECMGVSVVDEHPYDVRPEGGTGAWIYDFGLQLGESDHADMETAGELFQEAFAQVWAGRAENDGFNRLVLRAGLRWRQVVVLRAACKYLRQTGTTLSQSYIEETLAAHPGIARQLVALFEARFDPARAPSDTVAIKERVMAIEAEVDGVDSLDEDRILRRFLHLFRAMVRTNFFQTSDDGPKGHLSFKVEPSRLPGVPLPLPAHEIYVYSPRVEGVHLRGAKVARGGLRWSDRREDFRTEILGLMKAQTVKNACIVPMGAKGGFVVKRPPAGGDRETLMTEVVGCYRSFINGLLDLTDNIVGGEVVPPAQTVRLDEDGSYLVVAADKGTATFSDIANAIAVERDYWLGDAFASGGSTGYDHKKMGITARGAWESVKRHFRELGVNTQTTDFSVVGIGDMSGDVFGNGMLLSTHIRLLAAFDHRHVFIDPDPDATTSFAERRRLFEMERSSWADYDPSLISAGGGVYSRRAKSIVLSPEAQDALGVTDNALPPNELIRAVLRAPADLLWNGGIGTYVKASSETHADAHDRSSDAVRVNASELRCRVVGEGGNLGLTQRARVELALAGGLINTDAVDNSAGVDCSDREVNLKILLGSVVADGDMTVKQRNRLLIDMTDDVAEHVLRDNKDQTQVLSHAKTQAHAMADVHARYLTRLDQAGQLDRDLECLPSDEALAERAAGGKGLMAPELAVLLAYTKIRARDDLLRSDVVDDDYLLRELAGYFPAAVQDAFGDAIRRHPLRREIIATVVASTTVNRAGTTFLFRMREETGAPSHDIIRAHLVARDVFGLDRLWADIEACETGISVTTQTTMLLETRKLVERATRWLLRNRRHPLDIAGTVSYFSAGVSELALGLPDLLTGAEREAVREAEDRLLADSVPEGLARTTAGFNHLFSALDIVEVASVLDRPVRQIATVYFALGDRLEFDWLRTQIVSLPRRDRWSALAREALRDDLYRAHAALTAAVLRGGPEGVVVEDRGGAHALVEEWAAANHGALERSMALLGDIKSTAGGDLATLCVALREVRDLIALRRRD